MNQFKNNSKKKEKKDFNSQIYNGDLNYVMREFI